MGPWLLIPWPTTEPGSLRPGIGSAWCAPWPGWTASVPSWSATIGPRS